MSAASTKRPKVRKAKTPKPTRQELAERLRALAAEILKVDDVPFAEDNARMVTDILRVTSHKFESFPSDSATQRVEFAKQMVASLNALCARWNPRSRWWLPAEERSALAAFEAVRMGHTTQ